MTVLSLFFGGRNFQQYSADRHTTLEVKEVRDPVGKHGPCAAGHLIAHDVLRVAGPGIVTLRSAATYEDSGL